MEKPNSRKPGEGDSREKTQEREAAPVRWEAPGEEIRPVDWGVHPVAAGILRARGIARDDWASFRDAPIGGLLRPEGLRNAPEAAARIHRAVREKEPITLYGDYDADGITAVALGVDLLEQLGARVDWYINDRFGEGFGIGVRGVEELARRGTRLLVTADNGTSGQAAVARARDLGMEVVVTDHHEPNGPLPECLVVNPKQPGCSYPNRDLAGVGVLFKVLQLVCESLGETRREQKQLDLVALGSVADMVPLRGENRILVKNGLKLMTRDWREKGRVRPGIAALMEQAGTSSVRAEHLGFQFGPMLNAEGRLNGSPGISVKLLLSRDPEEARRCAGELAKINRKRKEKTAEQIGWAQEMADLEKSLLFLADPRFEEGLAGLVAGRLADRFNRPALVLARTPQGLYKGSGRAGEGVDLKGMLDPLAGLLDAYGGHAQACGLTVSEPNLATVKSLLETRARALLGAGPRERIRTADARVQPDELDEDLAEAFGEMEPFGEGFPRPLLLVEGFVPTETGYSQSGLHTRMEKNGVTFWRFGERIEGAGPFCLAGSLEMEEYRGRKKPRFRVEHIREEG